MISKSVLTLADSDPKGAEYRDHMKLAVRLEKFSILDIQICP